MRWILVLLLVAGHYGSAWADDTEPPITTHKGQFGLSTRLGVGVRAIATYADTRPLWCGAMDPEQAMGYAAVCTGRSPLSIDLEASYGVATSIEAVLELRIGIERDFGTTPSQSGPRPFQ